MTTLTRLTPLVLLLTGGCKDVEDHDHEPNDNEVITTVELTFQPQGGGAAQVFTWADPENDGSPVIDDITLLDAEDYTLSVAFLNELESPAEDITAEVDAESDEHQVFFTGDAVKGPATGDNAGAVIEQAYDDTDAGGLPVGLVNVITTLATGAGELIVTLRHMPPEGEEAVKVEGAAEEVAAGGFTAIGGDNDAQVTFPLTVE